MYVISKWNQNPCLSGMLSSVCWYLLTEVSGQPIGPILQDSTRSKRLSRNIDNQLPTYCNILERAKALTILRRKPEVAQMWSKLIKQV